MKATANYRAVLALPATGNKTVVYEAGKVYDVDADEFEAANGDRPGTLEAYSPAPKPVAPPVTPAVTRQVKGPQHDRGS